MKKVLLSVYSKLPSTFQQLFKYGVVGVLNSVIALSIIFILIKVFLAPYGLANALGYFFGLINSFILNKTWTFQSDGKTRREGILFLLSFAVCYLIQLGALVVFVEVFQFRPDSSQFLAIIVYTVLNFISNKFITFR